MPENPEKEKKDDKSIILPTDPEFKRALSKYAPDAFDQYGGDKEMAGAMGSDATGLEPSWNYREYAYFALHHALIELAASRAKLVMHFKKISPMDMEILGEAIYTSLRGTSMYMKVEASRSPIYRSQWDLIIYSTPFEAVQIRNRILSVLDKYSAFRNAKV